MPVKSTEENEAGVPFVDFRVRYHSCFTTRTFDPMYYRPKHPICDVRVHSTSQRTFPQSYCNLYVLDFVTTTDGQRFYRDTELDIYDIGVFGEEEPTLIRPQAPFELCMHNTNQLPKQYNHLRAFNT
jgi:hypothetical protein